MTDLLIIGAGGHARVVLAALSDGVRPALVDPAVPSGTRLDGIPVLGGDEVLASHIEGTHVAIGSNVRRRDAVDRAGPRAWTTIISPLAHVIDGVTLAEGAFVGARAVIQPGAKIGRHVIINTGAIVEHDCVVGDFAHVAPGAVLCGAVVVGEGALVGAGAVVTPGITIGRDTVIGAGAVVVADVPDGVTVVGNPARPLER